MEPRLFRRLVERRVSITTRDGGWGSGCRKRERAAQEPTTSWGPASILTHLHINKKKNKQKHLTGYNEP